jgi:hypothetical protein
MRSILLILTCLIALTMRLTGQISVTGAFAQDTVLIGSPIDFTLTVTTKSNEQILAVPRVFLDSVYSALQTFRANPNDTSGATAPQIADFEVLSLGQWTDNDADALFTGDELKWTSSSVGNQVLYENTFTFRMWDPGNNAVLYPPILYLKDGNQEQYYEGGQTQIFVAPPKSMQGVSQDSLDVAPIKPILTEAKNFSDYLIYIYILAGILIIALIYWLVTRWKKLKESAITQPQEPVIVIPAHEKALQSLEQLRAAQLWQKGEVKEYQSRLTFIIRDYLEERYGIPALESTTDEIVKKLNKGELELNDISSLKKILQVADLVKFAKAKPDESVHDTFMNEAVDFVSRTKIINTDGEEGHG